MIPGGIEAGVFLVFAGLGTSLVVLLVAAGARGPAAAGAVHVAGGILAILAQDLMTLLIGWEVLTFSAFILIRDDGGRRHRGVALRYLITHVGAAVLYFAAMVVQVNETGSLAVQVLVPAAQPLMVLAVLIKTATIPLHTWLVRSYPSTDTLVTPLLSVFTTKVGVVTAARLLRFAPGGYPILALLGGVTAVVAVVYALQQHNARRLLAYHIVSQVGYMIAGIGLAAVETTPDAAAVTAGLFHLVTHTLYKALLLLVAAEAVRHAGHEDLTGMPGLRFRRPALLLCALVGALAISGAPFTSGHASKYLLKGVSQGSPVVNGLLTAASVGTGLSFIKFIYLIFFNRVDAAVGAAVTTGTTPAGGPPSIRDRAVILSILGTAAVTLFIGFFPGSVPGVPAGGYHALDASLGALAPLGVSAILWLLLRRRLTRQHHRPRRPRSTPMISVLTRLGRRMRVPARSLQELGPQIQIFMILAGFSALVLLILQVS